MNHKDLHDDDGDGEVLDLYANLWEAYYHDDAPIEMTVGSSEEKERILSILTFYGARENVLTHLKITINHSVLKNLFGEMVEITF